MHGRSGASVARSFRPSSPRAELPVPGRWRGWQSGDREGRSRVVAEPGAAPLEVSLQTPTIWTFIPSGSLI